MQHKKPLRSAVRLLSVCLLLGMVSCRHSGSAAGECLIVSGGPALRKWENLRVPKEQHDRYAGNFIKSAHIRMDQMKQQPGVKLTWLVYRPAYVTREREDVVLKAATPCPVSEIETRAAACGARLVWFDTRRELVDYLNRRAPGSLAGLEYFGHSNKYAFLFDYSNEVCGASTCYLHVCDLALLKRGLFSKQALVQSWGCHTADKREGRICMSGVWKTRTGHAMTGAVGKTDYTPISDNRSLPMADPALGWAR